MEELSRVYENGYEEENGTGLCGGREWRYRYHQTIESKEKN